MGFHLTPKMKNFQLSPGNENAMGTSYLNDIHSRKIYCETWNARMMKVPLNNVGTKKSKTS